MTEYHYTKFEDRKLKEVLSQNQLNRIKKLAKEHGDIEEYFILCIIVNSGLKWMEKGI